MSPNFQSLCLTRVFFKTELCWNFQVIWSMFTLFFQSYKSSTRNGMFLNYYFQWYIGTTHIYTHIYLYVCIYMTFNHMLNKIGESRHPCLDPDLRGKAFSFSPLSMMLAVDLSYMALLCWSTLLLKQIRWGTFLKSWNSVEFCQVPFFNLLRWSYDFYPSFYYCITFFDLHMLNHLCI